MFSLLILQKFCQFLFEEAGVLHRGSHQGGRKGHEFCLVTGGSRRARGPPGKEPGEDLGGDPEVRGAELVSVSSL